MIKKLDFSISRDNFYVITVKLGGNVTFYTGQGGKVTGKLSAAIDGSYEG